MIALDKKVEVRVKVGSGINSYIVNVIAGLNQGNTHVQLAPGKNGTPSQEETALRMLQRDPASVLKQVNDALFAAGFDVDKNATLVDAKVIPGPNVPIHKNDPRLTPEFLATLVVLARSGLGNDYIEVDGFVRDVFRHAGIPVPSDSFLAPFSPEELDAAEKLDGKAPTVDGVMPQEDSKTVQ